MLSTSLLVAALPALAEEAKTVDSRLPSRREATSAVWTGEVAYIFGGVNRTRLDYIDEIVRYDPATGAVDVMGARLPEQRADTSAVWDGRDRPEAGCPGGCAYVFGGTPFGNADILRYNPSTDNLTVLASKLPSGRASTAAFWDGSAAYVVGGRAALVVTDQIVRFDPVTGSVEVVAHMPEPRSETAVAYLDGAAYIVGGYGCEGGHGWCESILRFEVATRNVTTLPDIHPVWVASAVSDGHNVFVFGGNHHDYATIDWVMRIDPSTGDATSMRAFLPTKRAYTSAVWTGQEAIIFGGFQGPNLDEIVHYTLAPGAPRTVRAVPGATLGTIDITWTPPHANTYSVLTSYRVYRISLATNDTTMIGEVDANTRTFTDLSPLVGVFAYEVRAVNDARDLGEARRTDLADSLLRNTGIL